jgi:hypothetical protein
MGDEREIGDYYEAQDEGVDAMDQTFMDFQIETTLLYVNFICMMTECHRSVDHVRCNGRLVGVMKELLRVFENPANDILVTQRSDGVINNMLISVRDSLRVYVRMLEEMPTAPHYSFMMTFDYEPMMDLAYKNLDYITDEATTMVTGRTKLHVNCSFGDIPIPTHRVPVPMPNEKVAQWSQLAKRAMRM